MVKSSRGICRGAGGAASLRSYRAVAWLQRYGIVILVVLSLVGVLGRVLGAAQAAAMQLFARIF